MNDFSLIKTTVESLLTSSVSAPNPTEVVEELLVLEKKAKKDKKSYRFEQLVGTWRLCFITGGKTGKSPNQTQMKLAQAFLRLIPIQLVYSSVPEIEDIDRSMIEPGQVHNQVQIGLFTLELSGPAKHIKSNSILAFNFTKMQVKSFGKTLFSTRIRNGEEADAQFYGESVREQAFFNYFLVEDNLIAARGRGGGLALWGRNHRDAQ